MIKTLKTILQVFVYGTLKPGERYHSVYCQGKTTAIQRAYTYGQLYHLCLGYPAMAIGNDKVQGYLLTFADESDLVNLDELETFDPQALPKNNEYQRQLISVYDLEDHSLGQVWGYVMDLDKIKAFQGIIVPSGWWEDPLT